MSFGKVRGQERAVLFLSNAVAAGRIANAYIFHGPKGVGKRLTAIEFAKALNCVAGERTGGCDGCPACKKIDSDNHPDVHLVAPDEDRDSIGIDAVRAVIRDAGLKPYEAAKKVYIIDEANSLTDEAASALLKTLEEPSSQAVLILIAEDARAMLPTIRSRCQAVRFFALGNDLVRELLISGHKVDEVKAHVLAGLSCGQMSRALEFDDEKVFEKRARIIDALASGALADWDFDKTPKKDLKVQLDIMLTWYRDVMVAKSGGGPIINADKKDAVCRCAKATDMRALDGAIQKIIATRSCLDLNANAKLAMAALGSAL